VPAPQILNQVTLFCLDNSSVAARDSAVQQYQVAVTLSAHRKWCANDFDFALVPKCVANDETWENIRHKYRLPEQNGNDYSTTTCQNTFDKLRQDF
jgi:hypothetical protein